MLIKSISDGGGAYAAGRLQAGGRLRPAYASRASSGPACPRRQSARVQLEPRGSSGVELMCDVLPGPDGRMVRRRACDAPSVRV